MKGRKVPGCVCRASILHGGALLEVQDEGRKTIRHIESENPSTQETHLLGVVETDAERERHVKKNVWAFSALGAAYQGPGDDTREQPMGGVEPIVKGVFGQPQGIKGTGK